MAVVVNEIVQTDFEVEFKPVSTPNGRASERKPGWPACASLKNQLSARSRGRNVIT